MIRDVVAHGARHAGSAEEAALEFACRVEDAVREVAGAATQNLTVSVSVDNGPLQVVITGGHTPRTLSFDR